MTRQDNKPLLTPQEIEQKKRDIQELKELQNASKEFGTNDFTTVELDEISIDRAKIREQIKTLEKQLEEHSPQKVTDPAKRDKIKKRREELEKIFMPYLETRRELHIYDRSDPEFTTAVRKATERLSNTKIEAAIQEWKRLGRLLEPDDPFISDLNYIRKDR
jgi:uncharacterized coiled-coil DUF342 family protein